MSSLRGKERATLQAKRLLKELSITAPSVDVKAIAESLGILVKEESKLLPEEGLSGLVKRNGAGRQPLILLNGQTNKLRQRFTLAHEIGHYLLHTSDDIHLDLSRVYFRGNNPPQEFDVKETEANYFAAELLMPTDWITEELRKEADLDDDLVAKYAKRYEVSVGAMSIKLSKLLNYMG